MNKQVVKTKPKPSYKVRCDAGINVCGQIVKRCIQVAVAAFLTGTGLALYADRREAKEKNEKIKRLNNPKIKQ